MSCSPEAGIVDRGDPGCLFLLTRYGPGMSAGIRYPGAGIQGPAARTQNLWPGADCKRAWKGCRSEVLAAGSLRLLRLPGRFGHVCSRCRRGIAPVLLSTTSVDRRGPPHLPRVELSTAFSTRRRVNMLRHATFSGYWQKFGEPGFGAS